MMKKFTPETHLQILGFASLAGHILFQLSPFREKYLLFAIVWVFLFTTYLLSLWQVRKTKGLALIFIIAFAFSFRFAHLWYKPFLSTDIYRYYWDGKVQAQGINPFRYAPSDKLMEPHRDRYWKKINFKDAHTIYPPASQITFLGVYSLGGNINAFRIFYMLIDVLLILILAALLGLLRAPPTWVLLYAWNPLPILEFTGSGHLDVMGIALFWLAVLLVAKRRLKFSQFALALSFLTKFVTWFATPLFWRERRGWLLALFFFGVVTFCYLPYLSVGSEVLGNLPNYASRWTFNSSVFYLLEKINFTENTARLICLTLYLALLIWIFFREKDLIRAGAIVFIGWICFAPCVHPWYMIWLLPFALYLRLDSAVWLTFMGGMIYFGTFGGFSGELFQQSKSLLIVEWVGFYLLLFRDIQRMYRNKRDMLPQSGSVITAN